MLSAVVLGKWPRKRRLPRQQRESDTSQRIHVRRSTGPLHPPLLWRGVRRAQTIFERIARRCLLHKPGDPKVGNLPMTVVEQHIAWLEVVMHKLADLRESQRDF